MEFEEIKKKAKLWIDANVWDGEDRSGCKDDWAKFSPDDLQELVDDLVEDLAKQDISQRECYQRGFKAGSDSMRDKAVEMVRESGGYTSDPLADEIKLLKD